MELKLSESRLWILAHQDDEVLALHLLSNSDKNVVVYMTDGVRVESPYDSTTRVLEARKAWKEIDLSAELIFFGTDHSLEDGKLESQLDDKHLNELISICRDRKINEIVTLQLEGGHQDHDITSMLAEEISRRLFIRLIVFPGYRALHKKFPLYAVMSPWIKNGVKGSIPKIKRIRIAQLALTLMKDYGTQKTTWIGLGPFVILKYLFGNPTYTLLTDIQNEVQQNPKQILFLNRKKHGKIEYEIFRQKISGWGNAI